MNSDKRRGIIIKLLFAAALTFLCGGIARILSQAIGIEWLDGIVAITGGFSLFFLATAIIFGALTIPPGRSSGCAIIWGLLSVPVLLLGLVSICTGVLRLIASPP